MSIEDFFRFFEKKKRVTRPLDSGDRLFRKGWDEDPGIQNDRREAEKRMADTTRKQKLLTQREAADRELAERLRIAGGGDGGFLRYNEQYDAHLGSLRRNSNN